MARPPETAEFDTMADLIQVALDAVARAAAATPDEAGGARDAERAAVGEMWRAFGALQQRATGAS